LSTPWPLLTMLTWELVDSTPRVGKQIA
jgi:hypothetical protein